MQQIKRLHTIQVFENLNGIWCLKRSLCATIIPGNIFNLCMCWPCIKLVCGDSHSATVYFDFHLDISLVYLHTLIIVFSLLPSIHSRFHISSILDIIFTWTNVIIIMSSDIFLWKLKKHDQKKCVYRQNKQEQKMIFCCIIVRHRV